MSAAQHCVECVLAAITSTSPLAREARLAAAQFFALAAVEEEER